MQSRTISVLTPLLLAVALAVAGCARQNRPQVGGDEFTGYYADPSVGFLELHRAGNFYTGQMTADFGPFPIRVQREGDVLRGTIDLGQRIGRLTIRRVKGGVYISEADRAGAFMPEMPRKDYKQLLAKAKSGELYHATATLQGPDTDAELANELEGLKEARVNHLSFQDSNLTDRSIDKLLELEHLETLNVSGADFTVDGLSRLKALARLRKLQVGIGQFTQEELRRLRAALPAVDIQSGNSKGN